MLKFTDLLAWGGYIHCILPALLAVPWRMLPISQVWMNFEMWDSLTEGKALYLSLERGERPPVEW